MKLIDNKGNIISGKGMEQQISSPDNETIIHGSGTHGQLTEDDFSDFMTCLSIANESKTTLYALTGNGGYLRVMWGIYGKQKLPRKLKKRVYLTHKLRKQYLPEYYL